MRPPRFNPASVLVVAMLAAACGRNSAPVLDDALKSDLALASQSRSANPQVLSPTEGGYAPQQQYAPQPLSTARRSAPAPVRRAPARRASSASSSAGSSGGYYPGPAPEPTVEKNTGRDAAIGAVAGAVIGATSSRNKVQGGLIGAAIGGILGGVVGSTVDVKKKSGW